MNRWGIYDICFMLFHNLFSLTHVAVLCVAWIAVNCVTGNLHIHWLMPLISWLVMMRMYVGVPMSICLHRYFSHSAFATSRGFQFVIGCVSCLTYQGGCLWWASKHLRHHKHCDMPKDPHSATQTSFMYAWVGWHYYENYVDWQYLPKRLLVPELLLINLLPVAVWIPFGCLLRWLFGIEWMLFLYVVPALISGFASSHFNVEYHPDAKYYPDSKKGASCKSIDKPGGDTPGFPLSILYDKAPWLFEPLVGEVYHDDHHDFPRRAHRPGRDWPYDFVLAPLERCGLIWDLQQPLEQHPCVEMDRRERLGINLNKNEHQKHLSEQRQKRKS